MSTRDAVALTWAILVSLAIAGIVPASWAIAAFPAIYVALAIVNVFVGDAAGVVTRHVFRGRGHR